MTEEEKELEKKYFGLAIELGEYGSHNLANYEHAFSGFYDCEKCGATVHMDQTVKHAKWHKILDPIMDHFKDYK